MARRYWLETLGCPKNQVDSDKLAGLLESQGYGPARRADQADLVVVNTCAFIEAAREESIGTVLELAAAKKQGAKLVVTGCMAERYGDELAAALPEVDRVAGFGVPVAFAPPGSFTQERRPGPQRAPRPAPCQREPVRRRPVGPVRRRPSASPPASLRPGGPSRASTF